MRYYLISDQLSSSYPILSCRRLPYLILSYLFIAYPIIFCLYVIIHLISFCPILSSLIIYACLFYSILFHLALYQSLRILLYYRILTYFILSQRTNILFSIQLYFMFNAIKTIILTGFAWVPVCVGGHRPVGPQPRAFIVEVVEPDPVRVRVERASEGERY